MSYLTPKTLEEALEYLSPETVLIAGGTDIYPAFGDGPRPDRLLDVTGIAGLRGITSDHAGWRIGAATTWSDLIDADLPDAFDGLKAAAREVGARQIQNAGTIAGNLCNASPAADGVPVLLTLNAAVECAGRDGVRRLPLADFVTGVRKTALTPGEIVTAIHIPAIPESAVSAFRKLGARRYLVISIAMVSVLLIPDGDRVGEARVAVGACSPVAMRLTALEAELAGQMISAMPASLRPDHCAGLTPIDDIRAPAKYRESAAFGLVKRALSDVAEAAQS